MKLTANRAQVLVFAGAIRALSGRPAAGEDDAVRALTAYQHLLFARLAEEQGLMRIARALREEIEKFPAGPLLALEELVARLPGADQPTERKRSRAAPRS